MMQFYNGKKILITGHTGFQGGWLSRILIDWGADVVGVALDPPTNPNLFEILKLKQRLKHYIADIREIGRLKQIFQIEKPEIVFHLAAQAIVRDSYDDPVGTYETNVLGTVNVLEAIRQTNSVRAAVIVTTDKVYQNKEDSRLYKEEDELGGYDPYSASKAAADIITTSYIKSFFTRDSLGSQYPVLLGIARSGNVIGGGDWGNDRLVPDIIRSIYHTNKEVIIRNPTSTRPWQHVLEPLAGYLQLAKNLYEGRKNFVGPWNFGPKHDEQGVSVEEVVRKFIVLMGKGTYNVVADNSKHEANLLLLDITKASQQLDWYPRLSFQQTLQWTCDWYKECYEKPDNILSITDRQIKEFFNK